MQIPNFAEMSDRDLHDWEFKVYETLPETDQRELIDIIGKTDSDRYYTERAKRLDQADIQKVGAEILVLLDEWARIQLRIENGTSREFHFPMLKDA